MTIPGAETNIATATAEAALSDDHPDSASTADTLAALLAEQGQAVAARELWQRALAALDRHRANPVAERRRVGVLLRLGFHLTLGGDDAAARGLLEEALAESRRLYGADSLAAADAFNVLGMHHKLAGRFAPAATAYAEAAARFQQQGQALPPALLHNLAGLACAQGDHARAEALSRQAIAALAAEGPSLALAADLTGLADALSGAGRPVEARQHYEEALAMYAALGRSQHPELAPLLHNLADTLLDLGERDAARGLLEESLRRKEAIWGPAHPELAAGLNNLAALLWHAGERDAARAASRRALQICDGLAPEHPIRRGCAALAACLAEAG